MKRKDALDRRESAKRINQGSKKTGAGSANESSPSDFTLRRFASLR
jgi:hypothetical protein